MNYLLRASGRDWTRRLTFGASDGKREMKRGPAIGCALNPQAATMSFHQHACNEESYPVAMIGLELAKLATGRTGRFSAGMGSARNHHGEAHLVVSEGNAQRNFCIVCAIPQRN